MGKTHEEKLHKEVRDWIIEKGYPQISLDELLQSEEIRDEDLKEGKELLNKFKDFGIY